MGVQGKMEKCPWSRCDRGYEMEGYDLNRGRIGTLKGVIVVDGGWLHVNEWMQNGK